MKQICIFILFILPGLLHSQIEISNKTTSNATWIRGFVIDKESGEAVISAIVYLEGTSYGAISDIDGFFNLKCTPGKFTMRLQAAGYFSDSLKLQLDSSSMTTLRCFLRSVIADSATKSPATENIYGLAFTKKGTIDSAHSLFFSLDSIVAMMKEKPAKKITIIVGYRYEDGFFEPLNDAELFIRRYLTSHNIANERIIFGNTACGAASQENPIRIPDITNASTKRKLRLFHHHPKAQPVKKGKGRIDVYWIDKSVTEVKIEIKLNEPR